MLGGHVMSADTETSAALEMAFLAAATAPGQVRTHVRFRLTEWDLLRIADDLDLIATELVTNAVEATPDGEIRVRFTREVRSVWFGVWDSSAARPVSRPVRELALADIAPDALALLPGHEDGTGGWGLPMVEALSSECGVRWTDPCGKWVWSRVAL
ncbi:ATP-binding protein [Spirillospora sp. CA-255316]